MTAAERVARVVAGVVRQALTDAGARTLILLDDGSPEANLARQWCTEAVGADAVVSARGDLLPAELAATVRTRRELAKLAPEDQADEFRRLEARLLGEAGRSALVANPVNKTALLLAPAPLPEPLLPLGDLYATDVTELAGGWSAPAPVHTLADLAGGIEALDGALRAHFDERRPLRDVLGRLPENARVPLARAVAAARFARRRVGVIPKLGPRTLGIDLSA